MRGAIFDTPPGKHLFLAMRRTQQCAVAAAHQSKARLSQTDDPIAQIVCCPITFRNALVWEHDFSDFAIGGAVRPRIQRA